MLVCLLLAQVTWAAPNPDLALTQVKTFYVNNFNDRTMPLSKGLSQLYRAAAAHSNKVHGPVEGTDFAWTYHAQDISPGWEKTATFQLRKKTPAVVEVNFLNRGRKVKLLYTMAWEAGRWVVDDIDYGGSKLSAMLKRGSSDESSNSK